MQNQKIFDISPLISERIAVWPGDVPFKRQLNLDINGTPPSNIDLSSITSTVHLGAHADSPRHYHPQGKTMEEIDLEAYWGLCQVIEVTGTSRIEPQHFADTEINAPRVLFKTGTYADPETFNEDFAAFSPDTVEALAQKGVILIGIDTPSVDPFDSKELPAHQSLYKHNMRNLEGLVLKDVPPGIYELSAIPLKIEGADASPVRAVLRSASV